MHVVHKGGYPVGPVKVHFGSHTILSFVGAGGYCASVSLDNLQLRGRWRVLCFCESRQSSVSWVLASTVLL